MVKARESEREGELTRVGQIPRREQRQKNRLNVQRSQAEKLPPPVAKGREKSGAEGEEGGRKNKGGGDGEDGGVTGISILSPYEG